MTARLNAHVAEPVRSILNSFAFALDTVGRVVEASVKTRDEEPAACVQSADVTP